MRNLFFEIKQFFLFCLRLFYVYISGGNDCAVCGTLVYTKPICKACLKKYFSINDILLTNRCRCCGKELISEKDLCLKCRNKPVLKSTNSVIPLLSYRLWNREIMFRWKMQDERIFSPIFASFLNKYLKLNDEKILVPVPPRKGKIRQKGWDQIEELCNFLEKRYSFKILRILERNSVAQQKKLSRNQRLESIKSAYSMCSREKLRKELRSFSGIMPQTVCLIDDVCTTGSTLESCAEILKKGGVKVVNAVTLFSVD